MLHDLNVVDRRPPTRNLHLCFHARSRDQVDAFYHAGTEAGFRGNGAPGYRDYAPGYYAAYLFDPDGNNIEALYRDIGQRRPWLNSSTALSYPDRWRIDPPADSNAQPRSRLSSPRTEA